MSKDPRITDEDAEIFRSAMQDVVRLPEDDRVTTPPLRTPPTPRFTAAEEREVIEDMAVTDPGPGLHPGEELEWRRGGVQERVMRKLRRGQFRIERDLDLHGMRLVEAQALVTRFIATAAGQQLGCVRIIHGKGHGSTGKTPVLKRHIGSWLAGSDRVLAFSAARGEDGGTGAVVVLLRRNRQP